MCRPTTCRTCGKTSWAGCGMHVQQIMAGVPKAQRCEGHPDQQSGGMLKRLFGR
ncbi:hypothetical protein [Nocardioides ferulae]|uniref:hypothetical protein n=1 Tax=Nocardioides ferulae TaxID=2340821 RepID=UPI0013DE3312|nr:hypothetical protein [Nocardioides ferulae]